MHNFVNVLDSLLVCSTIHSTQGHRKHRIESLSPASAQGKWIPRGQDHWGQSSGVPTTLEEGGREGGGAVAIRFTGQAKVQISASLKSWKATLIQVSRGKVSEQPNHTLSGMPCPQSQELQLNCCRQKSDVVRFVFWEAHSCCLGGWTGRARGGIRWW